MSNIIKELLGETEEVVMESVSDITPFIDDPESYLVAMYRNYSSKSRNPEECQLTDILHVDGLLYCSIRKAGNDLNKVNAYDSTLVIYNKMVEIMTSLLDAIPKTEKETLQYSIDDMKEAILDTIKERDEFTSKRKATLAQYSILLDKLK